MAEPTKERLDALRELATVLKNKEEVPSDLWTRAGVKVKSRLKDVEKEITSLKKRVSANTKTEVEEEIRKEAEELGVAEEDIAGNKAMSDIKGTFNEQSKETNRRQRLEDRQKKLTNRDADMGKFDMEVDYI